MLGMSKMTPYLNREQAATMATLKELLAQREELERQISSTQNAERSEVIVKVKSLMSEYNLSIDDLQKTTRGPRKDEQGGKTGQRGSKKGSTVAPKYKDPESGATWSGRGLKPKWLQAAIASGKDVAEFAL
jgi:DNA-binding protein H-NS